RPYRTFPSCVSSDPQAPWRLVHRVLAPRSFFLELPRARAQEDARPSARADERMVRSGRAMDEVPLLDPTLLTFDDQHRRRAAPVVLLLVSQWYIVLGSPGPNTRIAIPSIGKYVSASILTC